VNALRATAIAIVLVVIALTVVLAGEPVERGGVAGVRTSAAGDPERGALVYQTQACWTCHTLARAGTSTSRRPRLDLDRWLGPHAAQLGLSPAGFAAGRIFWGGRAMPAYGRDLTTQQLEDLVAFTTGLPYSVPEGGIPPAPKAPAPPPAETPPPRTVRTWVRELGLRGAAARGASLFAREGCLGCHTYRGSGVSRFEGGDPTRARRTAAYYASYVASPVARGNRLMPSYGDLGSANLRALGAFLAASRRR
jgi:mono/diheme cytochrome c family protein